MTNSERPSPEPLLKKEVSPAVSYRVLGGFSAVLSTGVPAKALRALPRSFRNVSGVSPGKSEPYLGYGLVCGGASSRDALQDECVVGC